MGEISGVGPLPGGPGEVARKAGRGAPVSSKPAGKTDSVEISSAAQYNAALGKVPEVRSERIEEIRRQIKAGAYLTDENISKAVDGLLKDL